MEKLLTALLKAVMSYVAMWLQAKKAERLEVKIKQIESAQKSKEIERKLAKKLDDDLKGLSRDERHEALNALMKSSGASRVDSPAAWNEKRKKGKTARFVPMLFCAIALAAACASCCKYTEGRWPVLPTVDRPVVPTDPPVWSARETILAKYAAALENLIDGYNADAKQHNEEHGYDD